MRPELAADDAERAQAASENEVAAAAGASLQNTARNAPAGTRPDVLVFMDYYLPGYKAGGPIPSVANMVEALGDEYHFHILTRGHDFSDAALYPDVRLNAWQRQGKASVFYFGRNSPSPAELWSVAKRFNNAVFYLNSFWSPRFSLSVIGLCAAGLLKPSKVVLAPRGEFSPGALGLRSRRKKIVLGLYRALGLYRRVNWHCSTAEERAQVCRNLPVTARDCTVAIDIPNPVRAPERAGEVSESMLRVVSLSRISRMKNLVGAIDILKRVKTPVVFDVYGVLEDREYWAECERALSELAAAGHRVQYRGPVSPSQVVPTLSAYDVLLLPTLGENFGHVIFEALSSGLYVVTSDQTPWTQLEANGAGVALPIGDPDSYADALSSIIPALPQWRRTTRSRVLAYADRLRGEMLDLDGYRRLFTIAAET